MSEMKSAVYVPGDPGEVSDGYHTFNELYDHRCALFVALARVTHRRSWKSRMHHDGKELPGWFLMGIELPNGVITYHLPEKMWPLTDFVEVLDRSPEWDGHTPADVVKRLLGWVAAGGRNV